MSDISELPEKCMSAQRESKSGNNSMMFTSKDAKATRDAGKAVSGSVLASKKAAREYLVGLGVSKPDGTLAKRYGG